MLAKELARGCETNGCGSRKGSHGIACSACSQLHGQASRRRRMIAIAPGDCSSSFRDLSMVVLASPPTRKWILAVFEPSRTRPLLQERAAGFGLTRQETRVAAALVDGLRVDTIADNLGISSSTVRQHLKSAFAKTKAHRQAELIARLLNP